MSCFNSEFKAALAENRLEQQLKHYSKYRLLVIGEIGYSPLEKGDERLLFQLMDRRYEKKSIIATSNIPFSEWRHYSVMRKWLQLYLTGYFIIPM